MELLPAVEIDPQSDATASVIWLHGLGADGHDFEPIIPELKLSETMAVRFILPHAPTLPITINGGLVMPAWFNILEHGGQVDLEQLLASVAEIHKFIDREIERGIASEKILLVGFSQGGAVCLQAGLTYEKPLAGILGLSTFFPSGESVTPDPANASLPIQIFHGTQDPMIPELMAESTIKNLKRLGYTPGYKNYPMPHSVCTEEIIDISDWLQKTLI